MLRASLRSSKAFGYTSNVTNAGRQWAAIQPTRVRPGGVRGYADVQKASIADSKPIVLPGSRSDSTTEPLPPGPVPPTLYTPPAAPKSETPVGAAIAPPNVPISSTSPLASTPPPPPPPPKRKFFRKFFTTIFLLSSVGFAGGVYYSRVNDNFHDFFTEYVPFGEEAVLYFEEREFRKRFPTIAGRASTPPRNTGESIKIPSQSGVSWKVAEDTKAPVGRHANATKDAPKPKEALQTPQETNPAEKVKVVEAAKKAADASAPDGTLPDNKSPEPQPPAKPGHPVTDASAPPKSASPKAKGASFTPPEVDQPSKFPPELTRIDPLNVGDAQEPLVQDLVKIINDIITVVNADNADSKFSGAIGKAKIEISKVGNKIKALKDTAEKDAEAKVQSEKADFERAAKELVRRVEAEMQAQQSQWQEEYQTEREKIQQNYEQKLKTEVQTANEVNEQRLNNRLLEQAVEMKRKFMEELKQRVEEERDGRLGKLSDLTNTVNELEKLTTDWNSVVDANLKTQHLHVAVEAVRSNLEKSQIPRPFTKELAALKEIASDDPVVNAAIASINPTAYQKGVPSSAQLIDRFRRVAGEVRKASLLPADAGVASHASSYVLSKLLFRKKGLATGNDVESILTRTETFLEEGDLDAAAREMNCLQGWAKTLSRDWLGEVRKVLEVQQALHVIATEARLQSLRVE
ncbi:related to mysoin heavy chain proteins [Rhynchosporium secalis]|uniref:MICOS complex subunit MIC60 n=1 Tax=Rhynchosporium secalis TaxID=38038 RepID=A0A1E1M676_RHYSE|nr:related to mysoin heavy chain proteins [Rhynchosporium secalis]